MLQASSNYAPVSQHFPCTHFKSFTRLVHVGAASQDPFHARGVEVEDEVLYEGHLFAGVLEDGGGVGGRTPEAVGSKHRCQIGRVHLGRDCGL